MGTFIHGRLARSALLYFLVVAAWGFFRFFRKKGVDSSFWGALAIAEILILAQGVLGIYLWIIGLRPDRGRRLLDPVPAQILAESNRRGPAFTLAQKG